MGRRPTFPPMATISLPTPHRDRLRAVETQHQCLVRRGDNDGIEVGEGSHVQDGFPLVIGKNCTLGLNVIFHGCTLEDGALVGMGDRDEWRQDQPQQYCRRGIRHHRGQEVCRALADHRFACARDPHARWNAQVARMGNTAKFYVGPRFTKGLERIG